MKAICSLKNLLLIGMVCLAGSMMAQGMGIDSLFTKDTLLASTTDCTGRLVNEQTFPLRTDLTFISYQWQEVKTGETSTSPEFKANETSQYILKAAIARDTDTISVTDAIEVIFEARCCEAQMPNAFTPNGDNRNDVFAPVLPEHCNFQDYQLQVYNRWGQMVFDTQLVNTDLSRSTIIGWDGKIEGKDAPSDVYVYWLRYTAQSTTGPTYPPSTFKGNVTLIR